MLPPGYVSHLVMHAPARCFPCILVLHHPSAPRNPPAPSTPAGGCSSITPPFQGSRTSFLCRPGPHRPPFSLPAGTPRHPSPATGLPAVVFPTLPGNGLINPSCWGNEILQAATGPVIFQLEAADGPLCFTSGVRGIGRLQPRPRQRTSARCRGSVRPASPSDAAPTPGRRSVSAGQLLGLLQKLDTSPGPGQFALFALLTGHMINLQFLAHTGESTTQEQPVNHKK